MSEPSVDVRARCARRASLTEDEVHLWWGRMDARESPEALRGWLSEDERRRCERFRRERDARAFAFRRAFRRRILAEILGCGPAELDFAQGELGKPVLVRPAGGPCFSASSAGEWVLLVVSAGRELGADVELARRLGRPEDLSGLARGVLSPAESAEFARLAPRARRRAFLRAWTRKEALLKALGTGLARDPRTLTVGLGPRPQCPSLASEPAPWPAGARLLDLDAPRGCAASLALAAAPDARLRLRVRA